MVIPLKLKYRTRSSHGIQKYRNRTGPKCCSINCVGKKKRTKNKFRLIARSK